MDYARIYNNLITRAQGRSLDKNVYAEVHHIVPRCMGGTDDQTNLATLTPQEHLLAHLLLIKIHPDAGRLKVAVHWMLQGSWKNSRESLNKKYANWRRYIVGELKKLKWWTNGVEQIRSESCPGPDWRLGMLNPAWNKGVPRTEEQRAEHSAKLKGRSQPAKSVEARAKSGHAGTEWWTNGTKNKRSVNCPGAEWQQGFTAKKVGSKGMSWYNNGTIQAASLECPGPDWRKGRLPATQPNHSAGSKWWTNGRENLRAVECPGESWRNGVTR